MTNMIPQAAGNNAGPWNDLEMYSRDLAKQGNELYVISGGYGSKGKIADGKIDIPERTWKVIVVLPEGENDLARITDATRVIAVDMPNTEEVKGTDWRSYRTSVDAIEKATGYDFLSNVSNIIQNKLEANVDKA
jgi:endonuclease G, mitochondrial